MEKKPVNSKLLYTIAGAAVIAGSAIAIADFARRKKNEKTAHVAELILGVAGVAVGALLATEPKRMEHRSVLELDDIFGDEDIDLARQQIRETLNGGEEITVTEELPLVTEDADDADLITADFI